MHIVQMIDNLQVGGAQKLMVVFAGEAQRRGIQTSVVSLADSRGKIPAEALERDGVLVRYFPARKLLDSGRLGQVLRFLRSARPDVLHTHLAYANIIGALAGRLAGTPVVATLHSTGSDPRFDRPALNALETLALRYGARRVIAVGNTVAEAHRRRVKPGKMQVIPNAICLPAPIPEQERLARRAVFAGDPARPVLICVGRFSPQKGLEDLITAFAAARSTRPEAFLVLLGDGDQRPALEARIAQMGLCDSILVTGRQSDVAGWLQCSDIYVSASHLEGLPLSILEAMAAGLPIAATAVGDVPDLLLPDAGICTPPHQPQALAEAILALLDQPALRASLGQAARARAAKRFGAVEWFDRLLDVYAAAQGRRAA